MGLINDELQKDHIKAERKNWFKDFAQKQKSGMSNAALMSNGLRDYYGPVKFRREMRGNAWVIDGGVYPELLYFADKKAAEAYAKDLKGILKKSGWPQSDVWAERVIVRSTKPYAAFKLKKAAVSYESADRFIIRMEVHQ